MKEDAFLVRDKLENPKKYYRPPKPKTTKLNEDSGTDDEFQKSFQEPPQIVEIQKEAPKFVVRPKSAKVGLLNRNLSTSVGGLNMTQP